MDKRTRLERLDALHRSRRGGRGVSKPPNLPPGRGGGGGSSSSTPSSLRGSSKKKKKNKGSPDDDDDDVARLVPAHVLQSLKVPAKKDGGARDLETLLETLLATNPKLNRGMGNDPRRPEWEAKLSDKTLVLENPTTTTSLAQAQKQALRGRLSNCEAARAVPGERKRFFKTHASRLRGEQSPSKVEDLAGFHEEWLRYASRWHQIAREKRAGGGGARSGTADPSTLELRGGWVTVSRSKIRNYDGVCGVVLDASSGSLTVVSRDGIVRTIPLRGSVFEVDARTFSVVIDGDEVWKRRSIR